MIEVEVRGKMSEEQYLSTKKFLDESAEHIETHDREMYLLFDYPGYHENPLIRELDIRLRNTDGNCEIMVKRKAADNNVGRHELSLALKDNTLDTAKEVLKSLGCTTGLKMHRSKDVYQYHDIEWSLVRAPKQNYYFEAEVVVEAPEDIAKAEAHAAKEAEALGLTVFSPNELKDYIEWLDKEVNEVVTF